MSILLGCSHCPDMHEKLVNDFGLTPVKTEWRTAWSVAVPKTFEQISTDVEVDKKPSPLLKELDAYLPPTAWAALFVLLPLYLGVGAVDWVDTIHSSAVSLLDHQDAAAFSGDWVLYILRHVLLYIAVSKFALEWQDPNSR